MDKRKGLTKREARKIVKKMAASNSAAAYGAKGGAMTRAQAAKNPDFFREAGARGGQKFKELMQDEDFRADHIRRSRLGKQFGLKLPRPETTNGS